MIITDEDKFELNNVELFSIEHYKEGEKKVPYYSAIIPKRLEKSRKQKSFSNC